MCFPDFEDFTTFIRYSVNSNFTVYFYQPTVEDKVISLIKKNKNMFKLWRELFCSEDCFATIKLQIPGHRLAFGAFGQLQKCIFVFDKGARHLCLDNKRQ
uniref:Uncharacterized protein n=1 Tax=Cacopsylla melanoneura TaxID=428564 RepID=A0A8D8WA27_9HEMI